MRRRLLLLLVLAGAAAAVADEPPDGPLLPLPDVLRPMARAGARPTRVVGGCPSPPPRADARPARFGPGEHLLYDVSFMAFPTAELVVQMNPPTRVDGVEVLPVSAYARTGSMFDMLGSVEGRMLSYVEPSRQRPIRMVNSYHTKKPFSSPEISREDAAFSDDGQVAARVTLWNDGEEKSWPGRSAATTDLVDALSVVYYARARELVPDAPFCFELYHRRRVYRVEGAVGPVESITVPHGKHRARRIDVTAKKLSGSRGATSERRLVVYLSDDDLRLPLIVETNDTFSKVGVRLKSFAPGIPFVPRP